MWPPLNATFFSRMCLSVSHTVSLSVHRGIPYDHTWTCCRVHSYVMSWQKRFAVCRELSVQNIFGLWPVKPGNIAVQGEKLGSPEWKFIVSRWTHMWTLQYFHNLFTRESVQLAFERPPFSRSSQEQLSPGFNTAGSLLKTELHQF